jgi:hypothetical protein
MGRPKGKLDCQPRGARKPKSLAARAKTAEAYAHRKKMALQRRVNSARDVTERQQQSFLIGLKGRLETTEKQARKDSKAG